MRFGEMLRENRVKNNFTLRELHDLSGVMYSYLSLLENDKCKPPDAGVCQRLADAMGLKKRKRLAFFIAAIRERGWEI